MRVSPHCIAKKSYPKGTIPLVPLKIQDTLEDLTREWNTILQDCARNLTQTLAKFCEVVVDSITNNFVRVSILTTDEPAPHSETSCSSNEDFIYAYTTDYLTMALLWHGFHDCIKMGDGNAILSHWKFMTTILRQTGHCSYAKEVFLMLAQSDLIWFTLIRRSTEMNGQELLTSMAVQAITSQWACTWST